MMRPLVGLAALFAAHVLYAQETINWYQVEVLVFENNHPGAAAAEAWRPEPGFPDLAGSVKLAPPAAARTPPPPRAAEVPGKSNETTPSAPALPQEFQLQKGATLGLNDALSKLRRSKRYRPLVHAAWLQSPESAERGKPVHLFSAETVTSGASFNTTVQPKVDGLITLRRSRFLHIDVDMVLRKVMTVSADASSEQFPIASLTPHTRDFRLRQSRRIRSDELHYFDHPLFGVLVLVSPYPLDSPIVSATKR